MAYTTISLRYHPDLIDDDDLPDLDHFKLVTEAYKTFMSQKVNSLEFFSEPILNTRFRFCPRHSKYITKTSFLIQHGLFKVVKE